MRPSTTKQLLRCCVFAWGWWQLLVGCCAAADFVEGFESEKNSWKPFFNPAECRLLSHRRHAQIQRSGMGSENLEFDAAQPGSQVTLEHELPQSRVLDELTLSLWVRSNHAGAVLGLRIVFPNKTDQNGQPLTATLEGEDTYTNTGSWQLLKCQTTNKKMMRQLQLLRARFGSNIITTESYVDRAYLVVQMDKGPTELFLDDLTLGPIVKRSTPGSVQRIAEEQAASAANTALAEIRGDRLHVAGRPFFPRIVPYHGEPLEMLRDIEVNPVWIPNYADVGLLTEMQSRGLYAMATPPHAASPEGELLDSQTAGLAPFTADTDGILIWNLGSGISPRERKQFSSWMDQLRGADNQRRRPLMADVTGAEQIYSRLVPMMGVTRSMQQTSLDFRHYRDWLLDKQKLALPGSYVWTWIETEPSPATAHARQAAGLAPLVLEPEQIRLQTYAALAAGCRGIGFWTTNSLAAKFPGAEERRLMIKQLDLELQLVDNYLAKGSLQEQTEFSLPDPPGTPPKMGKKKGQQAASPPPIAIRPRKRRGDNAQPGELEVATIKTDVGLLLLPIWYGRHSQFVPGQMASADVKITVQGIEDTAVAWEVTTTRIRTLPRKPVAGGHELTLPQFEMTTMVVITADTREEEKLRKKMEVMRPISAQTMLELAQAKFRRVQGVDRELRTLRVGLRDAALFLSTAEAMMHEAYELLGKKEYDESRLKSEVACQALRTLQRLYWNEAVKGLSDPVSSPHTICFQTLPDHWRMITRLGTGELALDKNLLGSGNFEDAEKIFSEGWGHEQVKIEGVRASAELYPLPDRTRGAYCLWLVAAPAAGHDPPLLVPERPVTVTTPAVAVEKGQIVHASGSVRVVTPVSGSQDGAMVYDSIAGPEGAIRWHQASDWKRFELIREVSEPGDFTLKLALTGLGEVQFDDIRIITHKPGAQPTATDVTPPVTARSQNLSGPTPSRGTPATPAKVKRAAGSR